MTSALTLLEVLVVPYRAGNRQLAERYESLLTRSQGIRMFERTRDQLRDAAQLCAATGTRIADALHLVSALGAGCRTFVTNDRRLPMLPGLRVIQLSSRHKIAAAFRLIQPTSRRAAIPDASDVRYGGQASR